MYSFLSFFLEPWRAWKAAVASYPALASATRFILRSLHHSRKKKKPFLSLFAYEDNFLEDILKDITCEATPCDDAIYDFTPFEDFNCASLSPVCPVWSPPEVVST